MKQNIHMLAAGLTRLLDEVEVLLESTADGTGQKLDAADRKGREALQRVGGHLRNARAELVDGARRVDGAVRAHPWRAIAATAVVSFVAGLLVRRR